MDQRFVNKAHFSQLGALFDSTIFVPQAYLDAYQTGRKNRPQILRVWALSLKFQGLRAVFRCGRTQARRALDEALLAQSNCWSLSQPSHFPPKPRKECVSCQVNSDHSYLSSDREKAIGLTNPDGSPVYWDELKSEVKQFWCRSEFAHFFTHVIKGTQGI
jgi:hypothetical protein